MNYYKPTIELLNELHPQLLPSLLHERISRISMTASG